MTPEDKRLAEEEIKRLDAAANAKVANGLIGEARRLRRIARSIQRKLER